MATSPQQSGCKGAEGLNKRLSVASLSPIVIPQASQFRRRVRENVAKGDPTDLRGYDYKTLFYDVYRLDDVVHLSGPPLLNLQKLFKPDSMSIDGAPVSPKFDHIKRTQRSCVEVDRSAKTLSISTAAITASVTIQDAEVSAFGDRNVIITMSKDNSLQWIRDWANFYAVHHDVSGVLIYDNGSTIYTPQELLTALSDVPGIDAVIVVPWLFPYGPQAAGIGAYGNFSQASMFEHARRRFLSLAKTVINADVDELALTSNGGTIPDSVSRSPSGAVIYCGRWIEPYSLAPATREPVFTDFKFYDKTDERCKPKWALQPARIPYNIQWRTHWLEGLSKDPSDEIIHRHFRGITTAWLYKRHANKPFSEKVHVIDQQLVKALSELPSLPPLRPAHPLSILKRRLLDFLRGRRLRA